VTFEDIQEDLKSGKDIAEKKVNKKSIRDYTANPLSFV